MDLGNSAADLSTPTRARAELPLLAEPALHVPNITEVPGAQAFPGLAEYMLRIVPLVGPNQYVVLPECQRELARALLAYHRGLGVSTLPEHHVLFTRARPDARFAAAIMEDAALMTALRRIPVLRLEPFVSTPAVEVLADALGLVVDTDARVADTLNHKAHARSLFEAGGVPTPGGALLRRHDGALAPRALAAVAQLLREGHDTCALTVPASFSGIGIRRVRSLAQAKHALATYFEDAPELLVEPWLAGVAGSPSFVLHLGATAALDRVIVTTDQLLHHDHTAEGAGPCHFGNAIPARHIPPALIEQAARVLRTAGARGIVGVDLIARGDALWMTEVNARQTGAIFGALTAQRALGAGRAVPCVVHNNVPVPRGCTLPDYVAHLTRRGLHFDAHTRQGVIVVSHGNMASGKVMVVAVGQQLADHAELAAQIGMFAG